MSKYRAAFIGTGGIANMHMSGYKAEPRISVAALCDIKKEATEKFAAKHELKVPTYTDYAAMLSAEKPDMVSICLWTAMHKEVIKACIDAEIPLIHCEKPMAPTWGDALAIAEMAKGSKSRLTFNHQRRFSPSFRMGRDLLFSGVFGQLERIEAYNPANILDWGTHVMDLIHMYNREQPARWVMGQIDAREVRHWFTLAFEFQALGEIRFENGVRAILHSGDDKEINLGIRLTCGAGIIEMQHENRIRWMQFGKGLWESREFGGDSNHQAEGSVMKDIIDAYEGKRLPENCVDNAIRSTETIFALYESARSRARIDLPLKTRDSAFLSMLEKGEIRPTETKK